jgi:hypothetical protein
MIDLATTAIGLVSTILEFTENRLNERRKKEFFELVKKLQEERAKPDHIVNDQEIVDAIRNLNTLMELFGNEIRGSSKSKNN